ncbi:hypothetical protein VitviT2T_007165 [Vitis vinifera]|uniref:Uncharacterized protein n=1 Tax=Vitis vinifera TaxID=29760 RepID=A0ABY9BYK0_VITVI|nr:hypothetical protein VitviT2T_007165 [Vitis vinifera]
MFIGKLGDDKFQHRLAGILKEHGARSNEIASDDGVRIFPASAKLRSDGECKRMSPLEPRQRRPEERRMAAPVWEKPMVVNGLEG